MIVTAVVRRFETDGPYHKKDDVLEIRSKSIEPCCSKMTEALADRFVGFGEYDSFGNRSRDVNIYHCNPYPEGAVYSEMPIRCCPWCGEGILIELKETK